MLRRSLAIMALVAGLTACQREPQPAQYPGPYPQGQYPGQNPQGQYPQPGPGPLPSPGPNPAYQYDPINTVDIGFLRSRAQAVIQELIAALPADKKARVDGIPLVIDDTPGEVNAFAACTRDQHAAMAITDELMRIQANLAMCKATDEMFGTRKTDQYIAFIAQNMTAGEAVKPPPAGFYDPAQQVDGRKVPRQHDLYDEQLAFVLGHELGHHYLGHLPCTAPGGPLDPGQLGRALSSAVPLFNQPNELAADTQGIKNTLTAGRVRANYKWTEAGALLTMQFFGGRKSLSPQDIFAFERTHPPAQLRLPWVQTAANLWRSSGGLLPP